MAIDFNALTNLVPGLGQDLLQVLLPYLPALARSGEEVYTGFVQHFLNKDWAAIDELMYELMTPEERKALQDQVYADAVAAAQAKYDNIQLTKEILMQS